MNSNREAYIHPAAIVYPGAELGEDVSVGPYVVIGSKVRIGSGCRIGSNVVIMGKTSLGRDNHVLPFATLGGDPQDLKYRGEETEVIIGNGNVFGECSTVHRGTVTARGATRIGDGNYFMPCTHVAHDSVVGDGTRFESGANPGGHVDVEDGVHMGSFCSVHPFCRIGRLASVDRGCMVVKDVPPYCMVEGDRARLVGLNVSALENAGYTKQAIGHLQKAFDLLFRSGLRLEEALKRLESTGDSTPEVEHLIDFLLSSERSFTR
ncbi:acyl-ACP--UDP-N-acetylglucosamine O-acyltransferase [bacterium]|nr:MAG: acyl-ACP--UDP-N-acetylglucosamine O-acyltransferase [bacterium]